MFPVDVEILSHRDGFIIQINSSSSDSKWMSLDIFDPLFKLCKRLEDMSAYCVGGIIIGNRNSLPLKNETDINNGKGVLISAYGHMYLMLISLKDMTVLQQYFRTQILNCFLENMKKIVINQENLLNYIHLNYYLNLDLIVLTRLLVNLDLLRFTLESLI